MNILLETCHSLEISHKQLALCTVKEQEGVEITLLLLHIYL